MYSAAQFVHDAKHIQSYLGFALVASVAIFVGYIIKDTMEQLTMNLQPPSAIDATGKISVASPQPLHYGSLVKFDASVNEGMNPNATPYITVMCFQGDQLVYQLSGKTGVKFLLSDPLEPGFDWNGDAASCTASLLYRVPEGTTAELYMLDSVTFDVETRP